MSNALTPDDIDFLRSLPASTEPPIGGTREQRQRAEDLPWGLIRECRRTDLGDFVVAQADSIAKLRDQILDYQQELHIAEQERDMLRADLGAAAGEVKRLRAEVLSWMRTAAMHEHMYNDVVDKIRHLRATMVEPTEQTGDEDSEHGAPVCVLCGRDIDVSAPFSTGPASGPAGRILGDDESAHGECLDHARQAVA